MPNYKNPLAPRRDKPKTPTYNMTKEQLDWALAEAKNQGIIEGVYVCNAMCTVSLLKMLRDREGYGRMRIADRFRYFQDTLEGIRKNYLTYYDIYKTMTKELKINLTIQRPDGSKEDLEDLFRQLEKSQHHKIVMEVIKNGR